MNAVQRLEHWGDSHHPKWLDIIRIGLGIFLCFKGIQILNNMSGMIDLMSNHVSFGSVAKQFCGFCSFARRFSADAGIAHPLCMPDTNTHSYWRGFLYQSVW